MYEPIDYAQIAWTRCRDGVGVSTIRTRRNAFETALLTDSDVEVVENYTEAAKALEGHARYVKCHSGPASFLRQLFRRL